MRHSSFFLVLGLIVISFVGCGNSEITKVTVSKTSEDTSSYEQEQRVSPLIVLVYHNLTEDNSQGDGSSLKIADFAEQMKYLHDNNYKTMGIEEFLTYYNQKNFPEKSVMITFDDGYRSFYTLAYPVLKKYNFNAVIFPIVGMTPGLQRQIVWNEHLTFHEIRLMDKESGLIDVGSHTYDLHHYRQDGQPAIKPGDAENEEEYRSRIRKDLRVSKDILELQTDQRITAFCWPYGSTNEMAKQIAQELGYKLFFTLQPGPVTTETPLDSIPRYSVNSGSIDKFKEILSHGGDAA